MEDKHQAFLGWLYALQDRKRVPLSEIPLDFEALRNSQDERDQLQRTLYDVIVK